jgi:hypothetical protein
MPHHCSGSHAAHMAGEGDHVECRICGREFPGGEAILTTLGNACPTCAATVEPFTPPTVKMDCGLTAVVRGLQWDTDSTGAVRCTGFASVVIAELVILDHYDDIDAFLTPADALDLHDKLDSLAQNLSDELSK